MGKTKQQNKKKYGWQQAEAKAKPKKGQQLTKKQEREQKKKERVIQQKITLMQQKSHTNHIKVIGVIGLQNNMQISDFIEGFMVYHKAARLQLPDGQIVFQTNLRKQLVLFQEITNVDQCFTIDGFLYVGISGKEETCNQELLEEIRALKLDGRENLKLNFSEAQYLAFLLQFNNFKNTGTFTQQQGNFTQAHSIHGANPNDPEVFRTTENFLFRLQFKQVPWLQDRFYMNVLGFEWINRNNQGNEAPVVRIYGCAHGKMNFGAQCLYLTNFGDQISAREVSIFDLQVDLENKQLIPVMQSQNKVFETPENQQFKEKLSSQQPVQQNGMNQGNDGFRNVFYSKIEAPDGYNADEEDEQNEQFQEDGETEPDQESETTESMSVFDGAPIQADYEHKRQQFKTAEELMDFPDEIDINPESSLRTILRGYHTMKSLRNSVFPATDLPPILSGELHGLYDVRQPVQLQQAFVKSQSDQIDFSGELIQIILTLDYQMANTYEKMISSASQLLGPSWGRFNAVNFAQQTSLQLYDNIVFKNQSLIGLFQHETRLSVCHVRVQRSFQRHLSAESLKAVTFECHTPWDVRVGFRRLYTAPTPYSPLGTFRGKLLRFYDGSDDFAFSFVCPIFLTRDAFPPVILKNDVERFNRSGKMENINSFHFHAQIIKFSLQVQILERVTLTGFPLRISRSKAVIKEMFFNKDDVQFFGRERLETENGIQGRILRSVTEKGYFKAKFDQIPNSNDVIQMRLYRPIPNSGACAGLTCEVCPGVAAGAFGAFDELFTFIQAASDAALVHLRDQIIK